MHVKRLFFFLLPTSSFLLGRYGASWGWLGASKRQFLTMTQNGNAPLNSSKKIGLLEIWDAPDLK